MTESSPPSKFSSIEFPRNSSAKGFDLSNFRKTFQQEKTLQKKQEMNF